MIKFPLPKAGAEQSICLEESIIEWMKHYATDYELIGLDNEFGNIIEVVLSEDNIDYYWIQYIRFADEEDLLAFKLRFGL